MNLPVVADASPLIGLARIGHLSLLRDLYEELLIPPQVQLECRLQSDRPGSKALAEAFGEGWLRVATPNHRAAIEVLARLVDRGEAEALVLAEQMEARFLLIDDRRGRKIARTRGLRVVGTGGALLVAKERGLLKRVGPVLQELADRGYRLAPHLVAGLLERAGEA